MGASSVTSKGSVTNMVVIFDKCINMYEHVTSVCRAAYCHLKNIHCLKAFLTQEALVTGVHAFVTSRLPHNTYALWKHYIRQRWLTLRSSSQILLQVPVSRLRSYVDCAFSDAAPILWNRLPADIRNALSLGNFKSVLGTHLFKVAFTDK